LSSPPEEDPGVISGQYGQPPAGAPTAIGNHGGSPAMLKQIDTISKDIEVPFVARCLRRGNLHSA
jgi:hypothetical protein